MIKKLLKKTERGQAIILIAFAFVGLIAMVGLMTDGGILLIEYARLKRGIDAASVAAAQQFRKGFDGDDLVAAADNFLKLNQSDVVDVVISMCDPTGAYGGSPAHDELLCPESGQPARKLVKVTATRIVEFGFMRVLGINSSKISASSVGEAASIDLVLIIDTSLSMTYGTTGDANLFTIPGDNPALCNLNDTCQPLLNVKDVARNFINEFLFFPYDRVAVVTMTSQTPGGPRDPVLYTFQDTLAGADATLASIKAYEPPLCQRDLANPGKWISPSKGVCLEYANNDPNDTFIGTNSPILVGGPDLDEATPDVRNPTTIGSSNVGGAFYYANNAFLSGAARNDAFWVVIALISGPANSTSTDDIVNYPDGFCPQSTWNKTTTAPCRDSDQDDPVTVAIEGITRHSRGDPNAIPPIPIDPLYDADDYARDAADDLANPETGNGITIFTIGLGTAQGLPNGLQNASRGLPTSGENLLIYAAEEAGDVYDPITGLLTRTANHGQYYFAEDPSLDLGPIFLAIAGNIFTRISQ